MTDSRGTNSASKADSGTAPALAASPFLRALHGDRPQTAPVWFMRQAGRSLPEYRELRARHPGSMLDACLTPELACEATLQPVRRHGVDAAVFYSDIMVPLRLAGVGVEIVEGVGPVIAEPVRTPEQVSRLVDGGASLDARPGLDEVREAVAMSVARLGSTPLIGFAGAPFTLACYLVAGRPSRDHGGARAFMHSHPEAWTLLLDWLAQVTGAFLAEQVRAGASAAQLFDSWAGTLSERDYRRFAAPHSSRAIRISASAISPSTGVPAPLIHFGTGTPHLLVAMHEAGGDAIGVDHRIGLDEASALLDDRVPLQGNIDPALLSAPEEVLHGAAEEALRLGRRAPAHILNLAHGVPKDTDPGVLTRLVEKVHSL